jgi:hypothetical protein
MDQQDGRPLAHDLIGKADTIGCCGEIWHLATFAKVERTVYDGPETTGFAPWMPKA